MRIPLMSERYFETYSPLGQRRSCCLSFALSIDAAKSEFATSEFAPSWGAWPEPAALSNDAPPHGFSDPGV
jgi:hypothetical protein